MKRNVSVVRNILISGKIIKEMPDTVACGTPCIYRPVIAERGFRSQGRMFEIFGVQSNTGTGLPPSS